MERALQAEESVSAKGPGVACWKDCEEAHDTGAQWVRRGGQKQAEGGFTLSAVGGALECPQAPCAATLSPGLCM